MSDENILKKIIARKKLYVDERKLLIDQLTLKDKIKQKQAQPLRPFLSALKDRLNNNGVAIISELKKASPSKGLLCEHYFPDKIAVDYEKHGAACLSVLTEQEFFLGSDDDLTLARNSTQLPVLRKDFIIDEYQIYETRYLGADCLLLIVAALSEQQLQDYYHLAKDLGLAVLIEINDERELAIALKTPAQLIGINSRNLTNFTIDLENTVTLAKNIPSDRIVICESGIHTRKDIEYMQQHNVNVFLIGEALVKCDSPGEKLAEFLGSR